MSRLEALSTSYAEYLIKYKRLIHEFNSHALAKCREMNIGYKLYAIVEHDEQYQLQEIAKNYDIFKGLSIDGGLYIGIGLTFKCNNIPELITTYNFVLRIKLSQDPESFEIRSGEIVIYRLLDRKLNHIGDVYKAKTVDEHFETFVSDKSLTIIFQNIENIFLGISKTE